MAGERGGYRGGAERPHRESKSDSWCPKHQSDMPCKECAIEAEHAAAASVIDASIGRAAEPKKEKMRADRAPFVLEALLRGTTDKQIEDFVRTVREMKATDMAFDPAFAELRELIAQAEPPARKEVPPAVAALAKKLGRSPAGAAGQDARRTLLIALPNLSDGSFDYVKNYLGNVIARRKRN